MGEPKAFRIPKEMMEESEYAIFSIDPQTNELVYANKAGHKLINNPNSVYHMCYQNLFINTVERCPAYFNVDLGIPNRRRFDVEFRKILSEERSGTLVLLNLKGFNQINTKYGFEQANNVLAGIAAHLNENMQIKKAVYHNTGDKFLFLLPGVQGDVLKSFLYELSSAFENPWCIGGVHYPIACDISAASFPEHGTSVHELLENVASALEVSRRSNISNAITYFSEHIREKIQQDAELEWAMIRAIDNDYKEFEVYYQPIIDTKTLKWVGCEALLRWKSETYGFLAPGSFLPTAERSGLVNKLGDYVLNQAVRFVQSLDLPQDYPFHLSINISPKQFYYVSLVDEIKKVLDETAFPSRELIFEIGGLKPKDRDNPIVIKNLYNMKALNSGVAIDDFVLDDIDIYDFAGQRGILKIGREITAGIETEEFMQTFMKAVIALSQAMDLDICVKGIETESQFNMMRQYGCTFVQGYYFLKPVTGDEFTRLLRDNI